MHFPGRRIFARQIGSILSSIGGEITEILASVTAPPSSRTSAAAPVTTSSSSTSSLIVTSSTAIPSAFTTVGTPSRQSSSLATSTISTPTPTTSVITPITGSLTSFSTSSRSPTETSSASTSTSTGTPASAKGSSTNIGAIVGGVVGCLAVLGLVAVALYWIKRRHPRHPKKEQEVEAPEMEQHLKAVDIAPPPEYEHSTLPEVAHAQYGSPGFAPQEVDGRWNQVYELPAERK